MIVQAKDNGGMDCRAANDGDETRSDSGSTVGVGETKVDWMRSVTKGEQSRTTQKVLVVAKADEDEREEQRRTKCEERKLRILFGIC